MRSPAYQVCATGRYLTRLFSRVADSCAVLTRRLSRVSPTHSPQSHCNPLAGGSHYSNPVVCLWFEYSSRCDSALVRLCGFLQISQAGAVVGAPGHTLPCFSASVQRCTCPASRMALGFQSKQCVTVLKVTNFPTRGSLRALALMASPISPFYPILYIYSYKDAL